MTRRSALTLFPAAALAQTGMPKSNARLPRPSPEFAISMIDGSTMLLSTLKGKAILVEFLLTTCPHCQKASQVVEKLYKEYGPRGFQPVGVAINDMAKMLVPDYKKSFGITFPIGFSGRDPVYNYLEHSPMMQLFMPTVVGIDRKFVIKAQHVGGDDFFKDEEKNLRVLVEGLLASNMTSTGSKKKAT